MSSIRDSIPSSPIGADVAVEQRDGCVIISGSSRVPAHIAEQRAASSGFSMARELMDVWTCGAAAMGAFGILSVVAMVTVMLLTGRPLIVNGRPLGVGESLLLSLGLITAWLALVAFIASAGGRMRRNLDALSGETPLGRWTLSLSAAEWIATEEILGASNTRRCDPRRVRGVVMSSEGRVMAEIAGSNDASMTTLPLTGPLDQPTSDWLRGVLDDILARPAAEGTGI